MKTKKIILILYILIMAVSTVLLVIHSSTQGVMLREVEKEVIALEKKNRELSEQIISYSSLIKTAPESESLGLVIPDNVVYLTNEEQFAWGQDSN